MQIYYGILYMIEEILKIELKNIFSLVNYLKWFTLFFKLINGGINVYIQISVDEKGMEIVDNPIV